jgi:hypothetical protein
MVRISILNHNPTAITVTLQGPATYRVVAKGAKNIGYTSVNVIQGTYRYSYSLCGANKKGTLLAVGNRVQLTLPRCDETPQIQTHTLRIRNETGGWVALQLTGRTSYNFNLAPGKTRVIVSDAKYRYYATGCGGKFVKGQVIVWHDTSWSFTCEKSKSKDVDRADREFVISR